MNALSETAGSQLGEIIFFSLTAGQTRVAEESRTTDPRHSLQNDTRHVTSPGLEASLHCRPKRQMGKGLMDAQYSVERRIWIANNIMSYGILTHLTSACSYGEKKRDSLTSTEHHMCYKGHLTWGNRTPAYRWSKNAIHQHRRVSAVLRHESTWALPRCPKCMAGPTSP